MRVDRLEPAFVESIPETIEPGKLYVSIEFRTTIHLCCCGCGESVVLPLRKAAWRLAYDGETVSLSPSVGNWSFPCRSHYFIRDGHVCWADNWSTARVEAGRRATLAERLGDEAPTAPSAHGRAQGPIKPWRRRLRRH